MERIIAVAASWGARFHPRAGRRLDISLASAAPSGGQCQRAYRPRARHRSAHSHFRRGNERALIMRRAISAKGITAGRTVLVIAHRLSTVRAMDRIVTLERGRLVEDGTHDTLIKTGGRYASLHRLQAGIHEVH